MLTKRKYCIILLDFYLHTVLYYRNTGRPRAGAFNQNQPPARKPFISMFRFAQLNTNVLVARSAIKKNRCILSQPILTAKWSNKLGACAQCNKQIKSNWSTPCSFCTQAAFCSNLCARTSAVFFDPQCGNDSLFILISLFCVSFWAAIRLTSAPTTASAWGQPPLWCTNLLSCAADQCIFRTCCRSLTLPAVFPRPTSVSCSQMFP